jgi:serine carboxypeptidase-like clade 2
VLIYFVQSLLCARAVADHRFPVTDAWHPWFGGSGAGGSRVAAGYATSYGAPAKNFAFITVKGAGHEVPTYKPAAAFALFASFLNGTKL